MRLGDQLEKVYQRQKNNLKAFPNLSRLKMI